MTDLSVTAANVARVTTGTNRTKTSSGTYGATVTAGQPVAKRSDDGKWDPADCAASQELAGQYGFGVALNGGADGQPAEIAVGGEYDPGGTAIEGIIYVASGNAGGVAPHGDLATDDWVTIIGVGNSSGNIDMPPGGPFVTNGQVQA